MSDDPASYFEANRRKWDERVAIHRGSAFYDVPGFLAGKSALESHEPEEVGDVAGNSLLHLQCHFGLDTLSWARLGADVTGLDFSGEAVREAGALAAEAGLRAEFAQANVYDAVSALPARTFDVVYTGKGALNWLPDMAAWASVAARLVAPGGLLYLFEFHPFGDVFDDESPDALRIRYPYFPRTEPLFFDDPGTYTDGEANTIHNDSYEWPHSLGEVITALAGNGLTIEFLHEFDRLTWKGMACMAPGAEPDTWVLPEHRESVPLMYSIRARKPAS